LLPPAEAEAVAEEAGDNEPVPRLMILKMVVQNFKSYAGKKIIGPFHKNFSAVVGPNGSGKSNVIDALLFVFGKKASKLRLKKVSELIHKSSAFPDCKECRVDVHFADIVDKGEDQYEIVPGTELVVSRYANKQNASKYFINDKGATWGKVGDLLRKRGIDLDNNRFLILQGEVESISMMKPKAGNPGEDGMLEYLEDIIGSNQYIERITKSGTEYEAAEESRSQLKNRVKAAEGNRNNLEGAKKEVEAFNALETEVKEKQWLLYNKYCRVATVEAAKCAGMIGQLKATQSGENEKMEELEKACEEMEEGFSAASAEFDELKKALAKCKTEYTAYERKDIKFREDLKHQKSSLKKILVSISRAERTMNDSLQKIEELKAEKPGLMGKLEKAVRSHEIAQKQMEIIEGEVKEETERLRAQLDEKREETKPVVQESTERKAAFDESSAEIKMVKERVRTARQRNVEANAALRRAVETKENHAGTIERLMKERTEATDRLNEAEAEKAEVTAAEADAQDAARAARTKMEECRARMNKAESLQGMAKALADAQKPGNKLANAGLLGRLGDLGAIDQKYDVAITTACSALNYLVTRDAKGATTCVNFLREKKLGRSTFIVLQKLKYLKKQYEAKVSTPENCPRLFDLVKFNDESLRPAFFYALRNTLVADNLEQAIRIAYQGNTCVWRVVTLGGELIEKSGAMSGGGNKVRRGGMGSAVAKSTKKEAVITEQDLQVLANKLHEAEQARNAARDRRRALEREIRELTSALKKLNLRIPKMEAELEAADSQIPELKATIMELSEQLDLSDEETKRLEDLESANADNERQYKKAKAKADVFQAAVAALEKQIMNAGGARVQKAKAAVSKALNKVGETQSELSALSMGVKKAKKTAVAAAQKQESQQVEAEKLEAKYEKTKAQFKQIEEDAMTVLQAYEEVGQKKEEKEAEVKAIQKTFSKKGKELSKLREAMQSYVNELEDLTRQHEEHAATAKAWGTKLARLREAEGCAEQPEDELAAGMEAMHVKEEVETPAAQGLQAAALETPSDEALDKVQAKALESGIAKLQAQVEKMRTTIDMTAIDEYMAADKECKERTEDFNAATVARDKIRDIYEDLRKKRLDTFMSGFQIITMKLKEMYQMITLGGDAELELVDTLDPFSEGIVFSVRPKGKSWKNICNLSGGEKTLSSLALVFALHHFKPTPLYVMDEIDAALDFKNVSIVANYIKERTKNAQFIIISLRNNMFDLANRLVGIYKTYDVTKSVAINPKKIMAAAKQNKAALQRKRNVSAVPFGDVTNA
jgi:structural maintenance of chromosome 4